MADKGADWWARQTGVVPLAAITVSKLAWLAEHEPDNLARTAEVALPHDWLTGRLLGRSRDLVTDRSDASGTGYFDPLARRLPHRPGRARSPAGTSPSPSVLKPAERGRPDAVRRAGGARRRRQRGGGDGAGAGARRGRGLPRHERHRVHVATAQTADVRGEVAGFADCTGRFLPLVCTLNAARVLSSTADLLGVDLSRFSDLALEAPADAGGLLLVPYLDGERTPNLPDATGTLVGLTRTTMTPAHLARAAVLGMLCGMADALDALRRNGVPMQRVLLIGGAAKSPAVRALAPAVLGLPVDVPEDGEYVARGAARQAAWVLSGDPSRLAGGAGWWTAWRCRARPTGRARCAATYAAARERVYG